MILRNTENTALLFLEEQSFRYYFNFWNSAFQLVARFPVLGGDPGTGCCWLPSGQSCALENDLRLRQKGADLDLPTVHCTVDKSGVRSKIWCRMLRSAIRHQMESRQRCTVQIREGSQGFVFNLATGHEI